MRELIRFRGLDRSAPMEELIRERLATVALRYPKAKSVRVLVDRPHHSHRHGDPFEVTIDLELPAKSVIEHAAHPDAYEAVRYAFRRVLEIDHAKRSGHARARAAASSPTAP